MKKLLTTCLLLGVFSPISHAQDWAIKQLENSPRHQEDITVKNGDKDLSCFLVYPEVSEKATVVILIHENRGLNDWARSMADQVAGEGFIVIAPDFITGMAPNGGNTPDFPNRDEARTAIYALDSDGITSGLDYGLLLGWVTNL
jgi:carboxymethylenebutenolidase